MKRTLYRYDSSRNRDKIKITDTKHWCKEHETWYEDPEYGRISAPDHSLYGPMPRHVSLEYDESGKLHLIMWTLMRDPVDEPRILEYWEENTCVVKKENDTVKVFSVMKNTAFETICKTFRMAAAREICAEGFAENLQEALSLYDSLQKQGCTTIVKNEKSMTLRDPFHMEITEEDRMTGLFLMHPKKGETDLSAENYVVEYDPEHPVPFQLYGPYSKETVQKKMIRAAAESECEWYYDHVTETGIRKLEAKFRKANKEGTAEFGDSILKKTETGFEIVCPDDESIGTTRYAAMTPSEPVYTIMPDCIETGCIHVKTKKEIPAKTREIFEKSVRKALDQREAFDIAYSILRTVDEHPAITVQM